MSDLISRQAAIDIAFKYCPDDDGTCSEAGSDLRNMLDEIEALPPAQPEQRWIPVSERMPEPRIDVWCNSDMGQMVGYYDEYGETWYGRDYLELIVTAWMPLPEPYDAESEDSENNE